MFQSVEIPTNGRGDIVDITNRIEDILKESGVEEGVALIFVAGSTAAVSATEYEPGVVKDIQEVLEELVPFGADYKHHQRWGDKNGDAHIKSALIGPDFSVPVYKERLVLGTWQQIILLDFDEKPRERRVTVTIIPNKYSE